MDLRERLALKLEEIADCLLRIEDTNKEIGAMSGISGNALFHFYYADYKGDENHYNKGIEIITEVFSRINKGYNYPTFCDGIAGACWVLELLKEEQFIELEEDIITEDVDQYLFDKMKGYIVKGKFDYMHGAIGIGMYFLKRYNNSKNQELNRKYETYIRFLTDSLYQKAIIEGNKMKWKSLVMNGEYKVEGYNLGLAHGIPSIIIFLTKIIKIPVIKNISLESIKKASNFLLSCQYEKETFTCSFPNWITKDNSGLVKSRLAWCYGDLGIGISLLKAGESLNDQNIINESINILKRTTKRTDMQEAGIRDAGLCHGVYGVIHIYDYLFEHTKLERFKEKSIFWLNKALHIAIHKDGYAGYKEFENFEWNNNQKLLGGVSGIGLSLLYHLQKEKKKWNGVLMLD